MDEKAFWWKLSVLVLSLLFIIAGGWGFLTWLDLKYVEGRLDAGIQEGSIVVLTPEEEGQCEQSLAYKAAINVAVRYSEATKRCEKRLSTLEKKMQAKIPTCDQICPNKFEMGVIAGHMDYSETLDCYLIDCPCTQKGCVPVIFDEKNRAVEDVQVAEDTHFIPAPSRPKSQREP